MYSTIFNYFPGKLPPTLAELPSYRPELQPDMHPAIGQMVSFNNLKYILFEKIFPI